MAVSRRLALLSIGTVLLCFLITRTAVADSSTAADCKDKRAKGDQCKQENDDVDDDFDDTYKIVKNMAVRLSESGSILQKAEESEEAPGSEEELGNLFIVGH